MLNKVLTKIETEEAEAIVIAPFWTSQCWFAELSTTIDRTTMYAAKGEETADSPLRPQSTTPHVEKNAITCVSLVRGQLQKCGLPEEAQRVILQLWKTDTRKQYDTYLRKWEQYCDRGNVNSSSPNINYVICFLTELHQNGLRYS